MSAMRFNKRGGMRQSILGVLIRLRAKLKNRDPENYGHVLAEFETNLKSAASEFYGGRIDFIDEFFQFYDLDEGRVDLEENILKGPETPLKACPFCGFQETNQHKAEHVSLSDGRHAIQCPTCQAVGRFVAEGEDAQAAWNNRVTQS